MSFLRGYRGFFRELQNTGTFAALSLQVRTGVLHVLRWFVPLAVVAAFLHAVGVI